MNKQTSIIILAITALFSWGHPAMSQDAPVAPAAEMEVVDANDQFALDFYATIIGTQNGNIFFSPYSISTALAMTYEGARGKTAQEIQSVFHFPVDDALRRSAVAAIQGRLNEANDEYKLSVANALWAQDGYKFLDAYMTMVRQYYGGEARNVDFKDAPEQARVTINTWVESKTNDKIKGLIPPPLNNMTRLILTNAIYFKGEWSDPFSEESTKEEDFRVDGQNIVRVPMMNKLDRFDYAQTDDWQIIRLDYKGGTLSMLVLLPKNNDLVMLEKSLSLQKLNDIKSKLVSQRVDLSLPKFTFDGKYLLKSLLEQMGMSDAFNGAADFSGMDGSRSLFIGEVIHQAFISVDERGTEAAAATAVQMLMKGVMVPQSLPRVFRADHPFLFIIEDRHNGNILFLGRVINPND